MPNPAAILVEEEEKRQEEEGGHGTPAEHSMQDSNESGGDDDIEAKIPSTGHLSEGTNHLLESGAAHEDLDAIPEEEPGEMMTPTPAPKREDVTPP